MNIQQAIEAAIQQRDLDKDVMVKVMRTIMTGDATPAQIAGFLVALRMKGETVDEIAAAATVMRELATAVDVEGEYLVDIVGTGGDGAKLFNVSTASTFVAAAAGCQVAKHGNRKMTSFSGSADVLEAAGVSLSLTPEQVATCIDEIGVGFIFAQAYHSAMRFAGPIRQEIGIRTLMNVLGPMTNPAGAKRQVIGVFSRDWQLKMAEVLKLLGSEHAMVVHSDGLDEFRLDAPTHVVELKDGVITEYDIEPAQLGLDPRTPADLAGIVADSAQSSLALVNQSLTDDTSAAADIVALNAGAAIYVGGIANSVKNGVVMAQDAISSGQAKERLAELVRITSLMAESS